MVQSKAMKSENTNLPLLFGIILTMLLISTYNILIFLDVDLKNLEQIVSTLSKETLRRRRCLLSCDSKTSPLELLIPLLPFAVSLLFFYIPFKKFNYLTKIFLVASLMLTGYTLWILVQNLLF